MYISDPYPCPSVECVTGYLIYLKSLFNIASYHIRLPPPPATIACCVLRQSPLATTFSATNHFRASATIFSHHLLLATTFSHNSVHYLYGPPSPTVNNQLQSQPHIGSLTYFQNKILKNMRAPNVFFTFIYIYKKNKIKISMFNIFYKQKAKNCKRQQTPPKRADLIYSKQD